jgi:hypothetical protein
LFTRLGIYYEAKLDLQVRALEQQLEEERANHGHTSEEVVHEAKQWLAGLRHSVGLCVVVVANEVQADMWQSRSRSTWRRP